MRETFKLPLKRPIPEVLTSLWHHGNRLCRFCPSGNQHGDFVACAAENDLAVERFFAHGTTKIKQQTHFLPRCSMYGIFTYIWVKFYGWHAGKYSSPMEHMGKETKI